MKKTENVVIYLSGAITGVDNFKNRFEVAMNALRKIGYRKFINPAEMDMVLDGMGYEDYMSVDFALIDMADVLVVIPDSENSSGVKREEMYALAKRKIMIHMRNEDGKIIIPHIPTIM